jgi:hypothetical protein
MCRINRTLVHMMVIFTQLIIISNSSFIINTLTVIIIVITIVIVCRHYIARLCHVQFHALTRIIIKNHLFRHLCHQFKRPRHHRILCARTRANSIHTNVSNRLRVSQKILNFIINLTYFPNSKIKDLFNDFF